MMLWDLYLFCWEHAVAIIEIFSGALISGIICYHQGRKAGRREAVKQARKAHRLHITTAIKDERKRSNAWQRID